MKITKVKVGTQFLNNYSIIKTQFTLDKIVMFISQIESLQNNIFILLKQNE